jgi:hypothetical protein
VVERFELPASTSLVAVTYNNAAATLDVEFRQGETYRYFLVPRVVVAELIAAPSAGQYFSRAIRPRFKEQRLI